MITNLLRKSQESGLTLSLRGWAEYMAAIGSSASTIRLRISVLQNLARCAGVADPVVLTRAHVITFLAKPVKPWTKVTYWRCIKSWDQWAQEFGFISASIVRGVPAPKAPNPIARPIDDETIGVLLNARLSPRAHAYVRLALYQALRVHEIAKVSAEDFDFASGWMVVDGKGGVKKPIPVHPAILELSDRMPHFGPWFPSSSRKEGHVAATQVTNTITNALRSIGSPATAHQLRDTAATRLQRQGKDIRVTQAMLRHSDIKSTMKYCAVSDSQMQSALNSIVWENAA